MAIFTIPKYKLPELEKQIDKIKSKGANVIFNIINENAIYSYRDQRTQRVFNIPCYEVEVSGKYIINGWSFVGTIEHSLPENIIRIADQSFSGRIPERYRTAPRDCEHCHIKRDRNDTYLIYNNDEDEWKQVGRTCLKNYTQGLDAELCAYMVDVLSEIAKASEKAQAGEFDDFDIDNPLHSDSVAIDSDTIRKQLLRYIKDNGYLPVKTVRAFKERLIENALLEKATDEEIQEITDAAEKLSQSDWSRNAVAAWNKDYIELRDLNLIASLCHICLENITKEIAAKALQASATNVYAGEIEDTVSFIITSAMVSHYRTPNVYHADSYPVYRITDDQGRIYNWGCTNPDIVVEAGKHIQGKIKATFEKRNGEKITELTRCKVS